MQSAPQRKRRETAAILVSFAAHWAGLLAILWCAMRPQIRPAPRAEQFVMARLEEAGGVHQVKIQLPLLAVAGETRKVPPPKDQPEKQKLPTPKLAVKKADGGALPKQRAPDGDGQADAGKGSDAQNVSPAFPVFSPRPPVTDRSLLPHSEQKIVVDVNVDSLGAVVSEVLVKGMGSPLDQIVLDTVKTWRFQPAMEDGKPVATQAELIFPFGPDYPIAVS